jgi:catechol 2,3-dioxygenase-like lactoylglutathione lyase family enzyme
MAITGIHASFATPQAQELRTFLKDVLGLPYTDIGGGFLVFDVPDAEVAAAESTTLEHDISFSCDDIDATIADLKAKGVRFANGVSEEVWGWRTLFEMPDGTRVMLYRPKYTRNAKR